MDPNHQAKSQDFQNNHQQQTTIKHKKRQMSNNKTEMPKSINNNNMTNYYNNNNNNNSDKPSKPSSVRTPLPVGNGQQTNYGACADLASKSVCCIGSHANKQPELRLSLSEKIILPTTGGFQGDSNGGKLVVDEKTWLELMAQRIPCLGIMLSLCASIFLGSAGMLVKMTQSVHGVQVAVFRAIIQLVVYGFVIQFRGLNWIPKEGEKWAVFGRATLGAASITCSYFALKLIPLGDATVIRFSLPIWTLIVSYLLLGESCSLLKVSAVVISISGVVLIAKPEMCIYLSHLVLNWMNLEGEEEFLLHEEEYETSVLQQTTNPIGQEVGGGGSPYVHEPYNQFKGSLLALSSSICLAMSLIALRLCNKTPAEITIVWLSLFSIFIGTITLISLNELRLPNNWTDVIYILLNGLFGAIGQWFITSALKIEQSGVISLARTFDIEVAFLYSAFLLQEQIRATSVVGSLLVSFGVIAVVVPKWLNSRNRPSSNGSSIGDSNTSNVNDSSSTITTETAASGGATIASGQTKQLPAKWGGGNSGVGIGFERESSSSSSSVAVPITSCPQQGTNNNTAAAVFNGQTKPVHSL